MLHSRIFSIYLSKQIQQIGANQHPLFFKVVYSAFDPTQSVCLLASRI